MLKNKIKIPKVILSGKPVSADYDREVKKFTKKICRMVKNGFSK